MFRANGANRFRIHCTVFGTRYRALWDTNQDVGPLNTKETSYQFVICFPNMSKQAYTCLIISVMFVVIFTLSSTWPWSAITKQAISCLSTDNSSAAFGLLRKAITPFGKPHQPCSEEYRQSHWIATNGIGRLGNQMFQLATLLATAKLTCRTPAISVSMHHSLSGIFNLSLVKKIQFKDETLNWKTFREACRHSWQLLNLNPVYNWTIHGYLNSWKNFFFYEQNMKEIFLINSTMTERAHLLLSNDAIKKKCPRATDLKIGMHIRRGDFLRLYDSGFRVANKNYTIMAREYFKRMFPKNNICFIVASDDMAWCKENILGDDVFYSNLTTAAEDMALMSLCNHSIVSTGTFGWFGAWLAGGKVVYFSDFPRRDSKNCPSNGADFIPPNWVGMP